MDVPVAASKQASRLDKARRRGGDESGVVAVVVAIMLVFVFLPIAALAIDLGSFRQSQQQAQTAADAGALAAAEDLPAASTSAAATDGTTYATQNYPGATASVTINTASNQATVNVTATTPSFFERFLPGYSGPNTQKVTATAVAGSTASSACSPPGTGCYAVFAMDQTCASNTGVFFNGGGYNILGGVHSNGSLNTGGGGSTFGPTTYGTGSGCLTNNGNSFTSGPTAEAPITTWPINYATDFPACSPSTIPCNASGTPSYCSASAANFTFSGASPPTTGYIYCAYGTTATKSDPTKWNGTITFSGGGIGSASSPIVASYIAGNVYTGSGSEYFATCGYSASGYTASACKGAAGQTMPAPATRSYPIIYAVDSTANVPSGDTYAVNLGGGSNNWLGDIFAPIGQVVVAAGSQTTGFIEAYDVGFISGGITGDGPSDGAGTSSSGTAALLQ